MIYILLRAGEVFREFSFFSVVLVVVVFCFVLFFLFLGLTLTSDPQWSYSVLIESEALLQCVGPHIFIEDVTASKIQNSTVVLILGN